MNTFDLRKGSTLAPGCAALFSLLALFALVAIEGVSPLAAARSFLAATCGSRYRVAEVLVAATPLLLCGLTAALSFRAGLFNIGAEGQLLCGMIAATALAVHGAPPMLTLPLAMFAGAALAAIAAWLRFVRAVPEVLGTLLLNFVALHLAGLAVLSFLRESGSALPQSAPLPPGARLPLLLAGTRLHLGIALALLACVAVTWLLRGTALGLRIRAAGAAPAAAALGGFHVMRDRWIAFLLAGALAGLAGGIEITGVTGRLYENPSPGFGYTAIAVALLGRLDPRKVALAALFFGAIEVGAQGLARDLGVSRGLGQMLQAVAILVFLATTAVVPRRRLADAEATA
jgi:ABC-type uncharacterized transport system permease subunit